jgi:protocatechuate 3,4-dioxygenase beta subunit
LKLLFTILFFSSIITLVNAQNLSEPLKLIENLLKEGKLTVNEVLADEKNMFLHSKTEFRNIIKKHAPPGKITIVSSAEPGKKIKVKCNVTDKEQKPFSNALVYVYQTSAKGWYSDTAAHILINEGDMRHARIFGYVYTDTNGDFEIETIQPSGYPKSDLPAHIHIAMWKDGKYVPGVPGELLFDDDERLTPERKLRTIREGFLVSSNSGAVNAPLYFYSIKLK